jgi:hypothetical protein
MRRLVGLSLALGILGGCSGNSTTWSNDRGGGGGDGGPGGDLYPWRTDAHYEAKNCGEASFEIARSIPDMLIVLDRSNSMGSPYSTLWDSVRTVIYDVTGAMDTQIWFGLSVFPSSVGAQVCSGLNNQCAAPTDPVVQVAAGTSGAIKTALTPMQVCGGTPTAQTLTAARQYLQTTMPANNHAKYILLATDGGPNCNSSLNGMTCTCTGSGSCVINNTNCLDDVATYKVLDDLCTAGIKTYMVGLGADQVLSGVLNNMAQHGCTTKPYAPTDPASIKTAFGEITAGIATCSFDMDCSKIPDPGLVNFYFDGKVVPLNTGHQSGWDWTNRCKANTPGTGTIEFFGADCDSIKNSKVVKVTATFGCATHIQ